MQLISNLFAALALTSTAIAAAIPPTSINERAVVKRQDNSGQATWYTPDLHTGSCSFSTYTLPAGIYGTALSDTNWDNAGNCGGCVSITYQGKTITAMIVDQCPKCGDQPYNHLDLYPEAFGSLANPQIGVLDLTWEYVPCPVNGPLSIHMKGGSSQYWFAAQVVNAHRRTAKMEVSVDQGNTWRPTDLRTDYNYFLINDGLHVPSAWIKVTSHVGTTVVVKDVPMTPDALVEADCNYE